MAPKSNLIFITEPKIPSKLLSQKPAKKIGKKATLHLSLHSLGYSAEDEERILDSENGTLAAETLSDMHFNLITKEYIDRTGLRRKWQRDQLVHIAFRGKKLGLEAIDKYTQALLNLGYSLHNVETMVSQNGGLPTLEAVKEYTPYLQSLGFSLEDIFIIAKVCTGGSKRLKLLNEHGRFLLNVGFSHYQIVQWGHSTHTLETQIKSFQNIYEATRGSALALAMPQLFLPEYLPFQIARQRNSAMQEVPPTPQPSNQDVSDKAYPNKRMSLYNGSALALAMPHLFQDDDSFSPQDPEIGFAQQGQSASVASKNTSSATNRFGFYSSPVITNNDVVVCSEEKDLDSELLRDLGLWVEPIKL